MSACVSVCVCVCPVKTARSPITFSFSHLILWKVLIQVVVRLFFIFIVLSNEFCQNFKVFHCLILIRRSLDRKQKSKALFHAEYFEMFSFVLLYADITLRELFESNYQLYISQYIILNVYLSVLQTGDL